MSALDEIFNRVLRRSTAALVSGAGYKCKSVRNFVKSYDNCSFSSIVNLKEQYIALCEQCHIRYQSRKGEIAGLFGLRQFGKTLSFYS